MRWLRHYRDKANCYLAHELHKVFHMDNYGIVVVKYYWPLQTRYAWDNFGTLGPKSDNI